MRKSVYSNKNDKQVQIKVSLFSVSMVRMPRTRFISTFTYWQLLIKPKLAVNFKANSNMLYKFLYWLKHNILLARFPHQTNGKHYTLVHVLHLRLIWLLVWVFSPLYILILKCLVWNGDGDWKSLRSQNKNNFPQMNINKKL